MKTAMGRASSRSCSNSDRNSSSAFIGLIDKIQQLPFEPFQQLVFLWLGARGFEHVLSTGRHHRRGRRSTSGVDFIATLPGTRVFAAIQIRHWRNPIQKRAVDELRGLLVRSGITTGVIVSNSKFSKKALESATEYRGRPVQLVGADDLAGSMVELGLGVGRGRVIEIDQSFFRTLNKLHFASSPVDAVGAKRIPKAAGLQHHEWSTDKAEDEGRSRKLMTGPLLALVFLIVMTLLWIVLGGPR